MMDAPPLAEPTRRQLAEGIRRFNAGLYWDAHEAWEEAWLAEEGLTKLWLQGLIQFTAAFHKGLRMGNPSGMARLFEQAAEKFERVHASHPNMGGLDLAALLTFARDGQRMAESWLASGVNPWVTALPVRLAATAP